MTSRCGALCTISTSFRREKTILTELLPLKVQTAKIRQLSLCWPHIIRCIFSHCNLHLSQLTIKPTIRPVLPAKTEISLYIHSVWQEFQLYPLLYSPKAVKGSWDQQRFWSDCADAQSDLSLCWLHKSYCRFCRALAHFIFVFLQVIVLKL